MRISVLTLSLIFFIACKNNKKEVKDASGAHTPEQQENNGDGEIPADDELLDLVQRQTFDYFWGGAEPNSGMAPERIHIDGEYPQDDQDVVTTGGSGFGLMAILVGVERGFISREEALERYEKIVGFLEKADRFHGVWPHWLYGKTGKVKAFSTRDDGGDLVETAFLVQGLLTVGEYFKDGSDKEKELVSRIDKLWREVEWNWYTKGEDVLYWHWSPEHKWEMNFPIGGYNECLVMYVLAAASPTHAITPDAYHKGWARNGDIANDTTFYELETVLDHYEHDDAPVGPLFWAHYSHLGLSPKGLSDKYGDYWALNRNHALINYRYATDNPEKHQGYGEDLWGLTSSYSVNGYHAHRPGDDTGVISPTAALSSFPYTPEESMKMLRNLYGKGDSIVGKYGPYDAFSPEHNWYVERYLAIDQGPIPVMIENYRSGLLWDLFMNNKDVQHGLTRLGFNSPYISR
ncbi:glucoamylase family protein [Sinomicrobium soli]|uniref:glucoamylase family protein n=1 Tax=Sinomicrobium sp. N-1-3-6 TaxID=2219864 RepID=UPI000DCEB084|nr:glucoamylase family protein [Sinomicrobium sp. N-1-3-6]RAV28469.1 beta-glucosidase [Sinomicrobium sp. N-1-3-6]